MRDREHVGEWGAIHQAFKSYKALNPEAMPLDFFVAGWELGTALQRKEAEDELRSEKMSRDAEDYLEREGG